KVGVRLVDVPLTQLAVGKSGAMSDQLVSQRSAHAFEQKRIVGVLENRPVTLLLDVLQILACRAVRRILLAHVAETTGEFGELLAVGALSEPADLEMIGLDEGWPREESDYGLCIVQGGRKLRGSADQRQPEPIVRAVSDDIVQRRSRFRRQRRK